MDTKNALQILEQLRQMSNVPEQTRQSLVMLCDVLNNADAHTPNEVHLANASLFALEQVLAGEFEQLGELYFNEEASWLDAATPRGYHSLHHKKFNPLKKRCNYRKLLRDWYAALRGLFWL